MGSNTILPQWIEREMSNKGTVLLVDDDDGIRDALEEILADEGYRCLSASNGRKGLDVVQNSQPDLILLDLMMPQMDGWEFMDRLRQMPRGSLIPVVVISADRDVGPKARQLGAQGHLSKPFDLDNLLNLVGKFIPVEQ